MPFVCECVFEADGWAAAPDLESAAQAAVDAAVAAAFPEGAPSGDWTVCALFTDDAEVAALNRDFRGKDAPTDVLSWPALALAPGPDGRPPAPPAAGPGPRHLGDMALAFGTVAAQADGLALALRDHAIHLVIHSCLHLLGYDHERDADARVMEDLERRAMASLELHEPYP